MAALSHVQSAQTPQPAAAEPAVDPNHAWKNKKFSFHDLLDTINPLQHIPIVASLYRYLTGDTIGNVARVAGDTLYGGPIGLVAGVISAEVQIHSGKDIGEHVIAMLGGDESSGKDGAPAPGAPPGAAPIALANAAGRAPSLTAISPRPGPMRMPSMPGAAIANGSAITSSAAPAVGVSGGDPQAAFLARAASLHRQVAPANADLPGRNLSNNVVQLVATGLPVGLRRSYGSPFIVSAVGRADRPSPAMPQPGATPKIQTPDATAPASPIAVTPAVVKDSPPANLPASPPVDISRRMLDALDKYARMQSQNPQGASDGRGSQLDLAQ